MTSPNTKNAMLKALITYSFRQLECISFFFSLDVTAQQNFCFSDYWKNRLCVCVRACVPAFRIEHSLHSLFTLHALLICTAIR